MEERIFINICEKNYDAAFHEAMNSNPSDFKFGEARLVYLARISNLLNRTEDTKSFCDSLLLELNNNLRNDQYSPERHGFLAFTYALLGNREKAIEVGEMAIKLAVKNKMVESEMKVNLAQIYVLVGKYDNACSLIAYLLNNPSIFSKELLRIDPVWKPLMDNPEYRQLILRYANN